MNTRHRTFINRYIFFNLPQFNYIFAGIRLHLIVAFIWLLIAMITIPEMHFCKLEFTGTRLEWTRKCNTSSIHWKFKVFQNFIMLGLPIIIFIMHIAIFNNLRRKRIAISFSRPGEFQNISCMSQIYKRTSITKLTSANNEASKNEISILIQGAIYCITAELEVLSFKFLRKIPAASFNDKIYICLNIVVNCLIICLGATQPTVYFICNKRIRHYLNMELMSKIKNMKGIIVMKQILSMLSTKLCCHFCQH
ncbi:Retrovirus-related Pol polyprotein from type-1 retrotransposable element R1 [Dirofilaria immitis]